MEILPAGSTDARRLTPARRYPPSPSIPAATATTPNEMVNESDVQACVDLLARYLEEAHTGDYAL